ncbi:D-tyrosyl-tRNA(Tyr) deacylase [Gurleya vavrai]
MDFHLAEEHFRAKEFFDKTIQKFIQLYGKEYIKNGIFGEQLEIMLINDGPVTIIFDTNAV